MIALFLFFLQRLLLGVQALRNTNGLNAGFINFIVSEGAAVGEVVGVLNAADLFNFSSLHRATTEDKSKPSAWFVLQDTTYFGLRGPDQQTVVVNRLLDRDTDRKLCTGPDWPEICAWSGVLFARNGIVLSLRITVTDVNDNIPQWPESSLSKSRAAEHKEAAIELFIAENSPPNSVFDLPLAEDRDYGKNGIVKYELVQGRAGSEVVGLFALECVPGPNGVIPRIKVLGALDRESQEEYEMEIVALDGGGQRGTACLRLYIMDENDNAPVFKYLQNLSPEEAQRTRFTIDINESLPVGFVLPEHPVATDLDAGDFGHVRYRFALSTPHFVRRDFAIDAGTGSIIVQNALDCDAGGISEYAFSVIAEDGGTQSLTAVANVVIHVQDTNDNPPLITVTPVKPLPLDSAYSTEDLQSEDDDSKDGFGLIEESPSGQLIATVAVNDPDADLNGEFTCELSEARDFSLKYRPLLRSTTVFQLLSARRFDREAEPTASVTIICTDKGRPVQVSRKQLLVSIIDVNDNQPQFVRTHYEISSPENNEVDAVVGRILARDIDAGENGRITYSLLWPSEQHRQLLSINDAGEIIAKERLDREQMPAGLKFLIIAEDHGKPPMRSSAQVTLWLEDINDCIPTFIQSQYHFSVDEENHLLEGQIVGTVHASDCDLGENAAIKYYFLQEGIPFRISKNGSIYVIGRLDRETVPAYLLTVIAEDMDGNGGDRALKSSAQVHITVNDVNDHAPAFRFPWGNSSVPEVRSLKTLYRCSMIYYEDRNTVQYLGGLMLSCSDLMVSLSPLEPTGHRIIRLQAKDADIGINSAVRFQIEGGNDEKYFHLHEKSGELFVAAPLPTHQKIRKRLRICVQDGGFPPKSSHADLIIIIDPAQPVVSKRSSSAFGLTAGATDPQLERSAAFTNTYIVGFIALAVCISFILLVAAIFFMAKRHSDSLGSSTPLSCSHLCFSAAKKQTKNAPLKQLQGDMFSQMPDTFTSGLFSNCDYNLDSNSCSIDKSMQDQLTSTVGIPGSSYNQMTMNSFFDGSGQNPYGMLLGHTDEMNMQAHHPYATSIDQFSQIGHSYLSDPPETRSSVTSCPLSGHSRNQTPLEWNAGRTNYEMQDVVLYSWCNNANERQQVLPNTIPNSWAV
ncbi:unnamed protein product [Dibothriocephalus latus]|uniref:Cadherin domain-containing protein n=1 Tax=Dibothriocephalus latus TaxID=60516 RepID=A0A3P6SDZ0_DIBLA|nr:unnamed protein product [Dibothriocephalus latus]